MGRLFVALLILGVGVIALGFYLGWFSFSTSKDPETGRTKIEIGIDQNKFNQDIEKAEQKVKDAAGRVKDRLERR